MWLANTTTAVRGSSSITRFLQLASRPTRSFRASAWPVRSTGTRRQEGSTAPRSRRVAWTPLQLFCDTESSGPATLAFQKHHGSGQPSRPAVCQLSRSSHESGSSGHAIHACQWPDGTEPRCHPAALMPTRLSHGSGLPTRSTEVHGLDDGIGPRCHRAALLPSHGSCRTARPSARSRQHLPWMDSSGKGCCSTSGRRPSNARIEGIAETSLSVNEIRPKAQRLAKDVQMNHRTGVAEWILEPRQPLAGRMNPYPIMEGPMGQQMLSRNAKTKI